MPAFPRYNEVQQKSVHNAYDRDEAPFDQIVWGRAHSVEFDVHASRRGFPELADDWYVYHVDAPALNHTSCTKLSDCLGEMRAFHAAFPKHEVVTVMIDLKDDFDASRTPADLDRRILEHIDRDAVVTPGDLVRACDGAATLADAVRGACKWPRLDALRGKFIFAMTGGGCEPSSHVSQYLRSGALARVGFAAPEVSSSCTVQGYVDGARDVGFVNMNADNAASATEAAEDGLIARVYGLDDEDAWEDARARGAHLLATNKVNFLVDPWATTHNARGWPFACFGSCSPDLAEDARATSVTVASADIDPARDALFFAGEREAEGETTWTSAVAVEGSHADPAARGCLMARASDAPDAPFFAVCRAAAERALSVEWRASPGAPAESRAVSLASPDTLSDASAFFTRIRVTVDGAITRARAEGSLDGSVWRSIGERVIDAPLARQGLAASSHDGAPMRFVFGGVTRAKRDARAEPVAAADLDAARIGACAAGRVADGFLP